MTEITPFHFEDHPTAPTVVRRRRRGWAVGECRDISEWGGLAACRDLPGFTEVPPEAAVETCETCPVTDECLTWGLAHTVENVTDHERGNGLVWGGIHGPEFADLLREYRQGQRAWGAAS